MFLKVEKTSEAYVGVLNIPNEYRYPATQICAKYDALPLAYTPQGNNFLFLFHVDSSALFVAAVYVLIVPIVVSIPAIVNL